MSVENRLFEGFFKISYKIQCETGLILEINLLIWQNGVFKDQWRRSLRDYDHFYLLYSNDTVFCMLKRFYFLFCCRGVTMFSSVNGKNQSAMMIHLPRN